MPNWCKNNLKIVSNGEKVLDIMELLKDEDGEMTFNKVVPMPEELEDTKSPTPSDVPEELEDTKSPTPSDVPEEERKRLNDLYGADNWYDWRLKNWGCKWNASDSGFYKDGDDWMISFSTPWGPPCEFMKKLSTQFPKVTFILQFADEGMGSYPLGECTYDEGVESVDGPEEGGEEAEDFANHVWDEEWVELG